MISLDDRRTPLARREIQVRALLLAAIAAAAGILRTCNPVNVHAWFPLSCGAVTGVPCIFCGTTRALHWLLNGDFARAVYFNWLACPLAAAALLAIAVSTVELLARRRFIRFTPVRMTAGRVVASFTILMTLWVCQVTLAVSQHKTELLNPRGPLYRLLVR